MARRATRGAQAAPTPSKPQHRSMVLRSILAQMRHQSGMAAAARVQPQPTGTKTPLEARVSKRRRQRKAAKR